ncbi:MAG: MFS transporter, partial [Lachnospiraceae bacterium]|nr:MFS transporter [Lachnospiraceae bacterium]
CAGASEQAMSQWSSLFAETGLKVSKNMGDLLGPCFFALLMGISRTIYGIYGAKMNLIKSIVASSILCIFSYCVAVFSPIPIVALFACAVCGFSVGIMWPGVFSLSAKKYPQGGTAMFALLALAGDVGCSSGPGLVGIIANYSGQLKDGLMFAMVFPVVLVICIYMLHKSKSTT